MNNISQFSQKYFFKAVGSGTTKLSDAIEATRLGSFLGRNVVRPGITKLGSFLGTLFRSISRDYVSWQATMDALEQEERDLKRTMEMLPQAAKDTLLRCMPTIAQLIPQDSVISLFDTARTPNESFSNFFKAHPQLRKKFVLSTENIMNLFERAKWDINKMSLAWKRALEETCLQNSPVKGPKRKDVDVDVLTLSKTALTEDQLRWIARYIPNVKKLHFKTSAVSPKIIKLCKQLFPKLQEITCTDTLEPVSDAEAELHGDLLKDEEDEFSGYAHPTNPNYAYCMLLDKAVCGEDDMTVGWKAHTKYGVDSPYAQVMRSTQWYKHLIIGEDTIKIEPPKDPDSKDNS